MFGSPGGFGAPGQGQQPQQTFGGFGAPAAPTAATGSPFAFGTSGAGAGTNLGTPTFGNFARPPAPATNPPAASAFTFGNFGQTQPQAQATTFGAATSAPAASTSAFTFGTPAAPSTTTAPSFGAFGQPAPALGQAGGTSFGAPATGAPMFGTPGAAGGTTFGTQGAAAPTFGTLGATAAPTFGTPGAAAAPMFGAGSTAPATSTAATGSPFSFGAPAGAGLNTSTFGSFAQPPAPATTATSTFSLGNFGQTQAQPTFGTAAGAPAATTSAFTFGTPAAPSTTTAPSFGAFGQPAAAQGQTTLPSFGAPGAAAAPMFGTATSASASAAPTATGTTFTFGTPGAGTTAPGTGFGAPATTAASGFTFGNFGQTQAQPTSTQPAQATTTSAFTGLGGIQGTTATGAGGFMGGGLGGGGRSGPGSVVDLPVPPEIMQIVEDLKTHMKNQKVKMSEVSRATEKAIDKVSEEVEETRLQVSNITNQVHRQMLACEALMKDIQHEGKNLDMALVTRDTPLALQHEITAPTNYFLNLVMDYNDKMVSYRREIDRAEIALTSLSQHHSSAPKDLVLALKGTKETVIALAARVQDLHEQVLNEQMVNRNLKRFPLEGDTSGARRLISGGLLASGHGHCHGNVPTTGGLAYYDQAYDRVQSLFTTPQRMGAGDSLYHRPASAASTPFAGLRPGHGPTLHGIPNPQLFQTASSTILNSPGSLKRTKH